MKKFLILIVFILILITSVSAKQYEIPLLAVRESKDNMTGSIAHLYLTVEPGPGRLYLDTFPLTKTDTQMSTRLSQKIACKLIEKDCDRLDFFYTKRAESSIIGGPSASAAAAIITVAALENINIKENISITGTISSGNIIGAVGGIKEKISAASKNGINTVLIPKGEAIKTIDNETINLYEHGKDLGVTVIEVGTLEEALSYFTDIDYTKEIEPIRITPFYTATMKKLAQSLCDRTIKIQEEVEILNTTLNWTQKEETINLSVKGNKSFNDMQYYSSASFCFGANVRWKTRLFNIMNLSYDQYHFWIKSLENESTQMQLILQDVNLSTITDLQTYMIVSERIRETNEVLQNLKEFNDTNATLPLGDLAYAEERLYSALSWTFFFDQPGKEFIMDDKALEQSCIDKLSEADEMYQYSSLYLPAILLINSKKDYDQGYIDYKNGNYANCLFKASKAKAQSNILISAMGIENEQVTDLTELKLNVARQLINDQEEKFPIVGYSYYEYGNSLKESDPYSALLYAEYSLEFSNLEIYFSEKKFKLPFYINKLYASIFLGGMCVGIGITLLLLNPIKRKPLSKTKRRKKI